MLFMVHLSNKSHSMELIAMNLTCTERESHGVLSDVANWKVKSKIHKFRNTI